MTEIISVPPDVQRVVEGLRDAGYELNTALADIIDNSIAAGAKNVDVRLALEYGGNLLVAVGDDGCGMDREGLINAMKYGSRKRDNLASLGKFGLGLKTASTAFCRRLVLVSRPSGTAAPLRAIWDLDAMSDADDWRLELGEPSIDEAALLDEVAPAGSGTVVIWDKVDRVLPDYRRKEGQAVKSAVKRIEVSLRDHVAMVYQRFLDAADTRARNVDIRINGERVKPWDPFCLAETGKPDVERPMDVELTDGSKAAFLLRAFILPRKEEFSSEENRVAARISNDLQGVYVYRENRLIHGPDWLGMYKNEPHGSLLRVELSFDHQLDDAFQVDIKKSRILLNAGLYEWLRDKFLAAPRREADQRSRKGAVKNAKGTAALLHKASNNAIGMRVESLSKPTVTSANTQTGVVSMENNAGTQTAKLQIVISDSPSTAHVATASTLENGVLWEPALIGGNPGVNLNAAHPYYTKAYLPNQQNSPLIQALDFLLWSLAQAELNNVSEETRDAFEEFRVEVSRNLKRLVADLPDPGEPEAE